MVAFDPGLPDPASASPLGGPTRAPLWSDAATWWSHWPALRRGHKNRAPARVQERKHTNGLECQGESRSAEHSSCWRWMRTCTACTVILWVFYIACKQTPSCIRRIASCKCDQHLRMNWKYCRYHHIANTGWSGSSVGLLFFLCTVIHLCTQTDRPETVTNHGWDGSRPLVQLLDVEMGLLGGGHQHRARRVEQGRLLHGEYPAEERE